MPERWVRAGYIIVAVQPGGRRFIRSGRHYATWWQAWVALGGIVASERRHPHPHSVSLTVTHDWDGPHVVHRWRNADGNVVTWAYTLVIMPFALPQEAADATG